MPVPNRVAFSIFGIDIMWYGILVSLGIVVCVLLICKRAYPKHGINQDRIFNWTILFIICGIVGARLYYILFNWSYYSEHTEKIFALREGGLAIHGGLILPVIIALILCGIFNERPLNLLDLYFAVIPLGQAIGRWGNYFNSEAHGGPTNLPWAITVDGVSVHPTFLYESIWCLLLFVILILVDNHRKFTGQTFLLYCMLYSLERFIVEGLRTDSLMLFGVIKQAQALSAVLFIGALALYIKLRQGKKSRKRKS
ncbi:MAG: prolipoprotein diacylglyceryl transferase [Clostridiales Family XIII bacterium]|jgi:phosphatidylglycerol:prolipoprotein diacylglycerol transferase|nr:prolipoprotein diacylglyceryl transferase [Clostridiales Family XIII bacterium]